MKSERSESVSVVICAYSDLRWTDLVEAIDSVRNQSCKPMEIIVAVDHNGQLLERVHREVPDVLAVPNSGSRGLSGARNSGIVASSGDIVAFLDDDAIADADWLQHLIAGFDSADVLSVGGSISPKWESEMPGWFPPEFLWVVGCSYRGLPKVQATVRNVIGANMAFRRGVFAEVGEFRSGIGRIGTKPVGCEETELCIRVRQRWPHGVVRYQPAANVFHKVPASRRTVSYFRARCFAEGRSKALVSTMVGSTDGLESERAYTLRTLPAGAIAGLKDVLRGDISGLARSMAIVAGLAITALGYGVGRLERRRPDRPGSVLATADLVSSATQSRY